MSSSRWRAWALLAVVLPTAGWVFYESQRLFRADLASAGARQKVALWVSGAATPKSRAEWDEARELIALSLAITPEIQISLAAVKELPAGRKSSLGIYVLAGSVIFLALTSLVILFWAPAWKQSGKVSPKQ